jgi:hypothetical protein
MDLLKHIEQKSKGYFKHGFVVCDEKNLDENSDLIIEQFRVSYLKKI